MALLCASCAAAPQHAEQPPPSPAPALETAKVAALGISEPKAAPLEADTPMATFEGATFVAPKGWNVVIRGPLTLLSPPEDDSHIALVDVRAKDADAAVAAAWAAYKPDARWPKRVATPSPNKDGWTDRWSYRYETSPDERRGVGVEVQRAGEVWTVAIHDVADAVWEKRQSQLVLIFDHLFPKGFLAESFAGKKANKLDEARIAELKKFIETAQKSLGIPGVSLGLVQDGKVIFAGGFGARELGSPQKPDADTLYMIGSNTKALTTLMLAKLVDERKISWDTPVTSLLPSFRLGDADTTRQVLVKHLVCACTGLPRQDLEFLFQFKGVTPEGEMAVLASMQPTSKFGEMYQYSNLMAAAGGFVGGHVLFPTRELGAAYDEAMRTRVFEPLGMSSTTFDYARALKRNHASPHAPDIDGHTARAAMDINYCAIPVRPAGAAWSSVHDMLRYVQMELSRGVLPDGKRYISEDALLARRAPQVTIGNDITYGMGLMVESKYGTTVVHHGGATTGFRSDMMWLPEHAVGAVVLTNSSLGARLHDCFKRKLLEVLFDGRPEADAEVRARSDAFFSRLAAERKHLTVPADAGEAAKLASHYVSEALGDITVRQGKGAKGATVFDFDEWKSEVASRNNSDGSISFVTTAPGVDGFEFVVGGKEKRTLTLRDGQHEYVFVEG